MVSDPINKDIDPETMQLIELLFFAYRDFVSDPDAILSRFGFGRAHHRVLHFVNRNPGITVSELLDILSITKQSLAPILKQLVDDGYIEQVQSEDDRRRRLLRTTEKGSELAFTLNVPQVKRIEAALSKLDGSAIDAARDFLTQMTNRKAD